MISRALLDRRGYRVLYCREVSARTVSCRYQGTLAETYPRVKTLSSDVFPHAPSPLCCLSPVEGLPKAMNIYSRTSFRWTVLEPPQRGIVDLVVCGDQASLRRLLAQLVPGTGNERRKDGGGDSRLEVLLSRRDAYGRKYGW